MLAAREEFRLAVEAARESGETLADVGAAAQMTQQASRLSFAARATEPTAPKTRAGVAGVSVPP
jgi:hypothetical protein